jgi:hypothetical protein
MTFRLCGKEYSGERAVTIVGAMERDADNYPHRGAGLRQFLHWSLAHLTDRIPRRELEPGARLDEETLALGYLYLLDEYGVGQFVLNPREEGEVYISGPSGS